MIGTGLRADPYASRFEIGGMPDEIDTPQGERRLPQVVFDRKRCPETPARFSPRVDKPRLPQKAVFLVLICDVEITQQQRWAAFGHQLDEQRRVIDRA